MILEQTVAENAWLLEEGLHRILLPLRWAVPFVNVYLLESRGQYMLVDCGLNSQTSLRALGRALKAIGVPAHGLSFLLLTHRHPDHAAGAGPVSERWGGRALLHPDDMGHFYPTGDEAVEWGRENGVPEELLEFLAARRPNFREEMPQNLEPLDAAQPLRLGDLEFEVIHVPGHCPGQVMLREQSRGWLLAADQVVPPEAPNVWYNPGSGGDPLGDYLESLGRTAGIEAELVLPSHGMPMRGGLRGTVGRQLEFQMAYLRRVFASLGREPASTWAVAAQIDPNAKDPSVLAEVLAALVHLERRGEIRRTDGRLWTQT